MDELEIKALLDFTEQHAEEDPLRLVLQQRQYPDIDLKTVAQQIEGRRQARAKWPSLLSCPCYLYPPKLNCEQSSSEETARIKRLIIEELHHDRDRALAIADLTGGMGIDCMALGGWPDCKNGNHVDYVEHDLELCSLMKHNTEALGMNNIACHCRDSMQWLGESEKQFDILFMDPARRDRQGRKVAAFEDCQPDITANRNLLQSRCDTLIVKASPMIDIDRGIAQLGEVQDVHIVSVKGECKEVLYVCKRHEGETRIHCHSLTANPSRHERMSFTRNEEAATEASYCTEIEAYLYEPDAALMKGGPYKLLGRRNNVKQLGPGTHLYTHGELIGWQGRRFKVLKELALNKKSISRELPQRKAHVVARNYPTTAETLMKQTGLEEGGELYVIATTLGNRKIGLLCERV